MAGKNGKPVETQPHAQVRPSIWAGRLALGRFVLTLSVNRQREQVEPRAQMANRLAALRQERGLECEELAGQLHIHPSTLLALEKGSYEPSLRLALRISEVFELPIEAIFFFPTTKHVVSAELADEEEVNART